MAYPLAITLLFLISPVASLAFALHGLFTSKKYSMWFGIIFAAAVGLLVYSIVPNPEMDLYRYYQYLDEANRYNFLDIITSIWSTGDPLAYSFMYLISHTFTNHFVPLAVSLVDYSILFYIIFDYRKRFIKAHDWRVQTVLLFVLATFIVFSSITGVRFGLAMVVFLLALYLDTARKLKRLPKLLYLLAILTHASMLLMALLRIGVWIFSRRPIIFYILAIATGSASSLLLIFSEQLSIVPFLSQVGERAADYLIPNVPPGFLYPFNLLACVLMLTVVLLTKKRKTPLSTMAKLNIATILIALANSYQFVIASRFTTISKFLFIIVLLEILADHKGHHFTRRELIAIILIIVIILGNLAFQFIALSGVEFTWNFPDILLKNVMQILGTS